MTTDFKRLDIDGLCERLCENKSTLIIYHVRSDADAVGSAFALRELLREMGTVAFCACAEEVPERLKFLSEAVQGSVVPAEGMPMGHERTISVDSASPSQLGELFDRLHKSIDIMIDHHATGTVYADNYIDSEAAATGEIIYSVAKRLVETGKISAVPPRAVNCLYAAISSDTGGFRFANVTPATHRVAAELLEAGADAADINHRLFESKTLKQLSAEGEAIRRLKTYCDGRIASVTVPYSSKLALGLCDESLETIIDIPRSIGGVEVAFSVRQPEQDTFFRVSMRSACDSIDVAELCKGFGGGGHARAAGCSLRAANIDEAESAVYRAILQYIKNR